MKKDNFDVYVGFKEHKKLINKHYDFSIIGNLCVSEWHEYEEGEGERMLIENFNTDEIKKREKIWGKLYSYCSKIYMHDTDYDELIK